MKQNDEHSEDDYTILIPVRHTNLFETLFPPAIRAAKKNSGKIILLNAVRVPFKVPVSMADAIAGDRLLMLKEGQDLLQEAGCECEIMTQITTSLTSAIKEIVESRAVDLVIMGSRRKAGFIFKSKLPHKLITLECPIMLSSNNGKAEFKNIVVFTNGLQNVTTMLEHAAFLLDGPAPEMYVIQPSKEQQKKDHLKAVIDEFEKKQQGIKARVFLTPDCAKDEIIEKKVTNDKQNICIFYPYTERKWLKHLFHAGDLIRTDYPIFLFKP